MASRIMHLAMADGILHEIRIKDENRFCIGAILPDAYSSGVNTAVSHFKTKFLNNTKITYRLDYFRTTYQRELQQDDLYLGYYMHLVQDILFRQFVYEDNSWNPIPEGNIERLHNDYRLLNTYITQHYGLVNNLVVPAEIEHERLFDVYPFDLLHMMEGLKSDFVPYKTGECFFFTRAMADEYIQKTIVSCAKEINSLRNGGILIDEKALAWDAH